MTKEEIKETFKSIISSPPTDIYKDDLDVRESNIELIEEREVEGELTREIGSANLFLASAFLGTIHGIEIPAEDKSTLKVLANLWQDMIKELKEENYLREKPTSVRESFKVV
jgi:hypothetical protein